MTTTVTTTALNATYTCAQELSPLAKRRHAFNKEKVGKEIAEKMPFCSWVSIQSILSFFDNVRTNVVGVNLSEEEAEHIQRLPLGNPKLWQAVQAYATAHEQQVLCAIQEVSTGIIVYVSENYQAAHEVSPQCLSRYTD